MSRRLVVLCFMVGMVAIGTGAIAAGTNLLPNGTFEGSGNGSLSGWKGSHATLSLVAGDASPKAARVALSGTATTYSIVAQPAVVSAANAGTVYTATGRVSALSGKKVCLRLKESGSQSASAMACAFGTGTWMTMPALAYTAKASGDSLAFSVLQKTATSGNSFTVDNLSVTTGGGGIQPPTNVTASAKSTTAIHVSWTASVTSGVTSYQIFRNGGNQPIATVPVPGTSYDDSGLSPGTSYTYVLTASDGTNTSGPSNPATAITDGGGGGVVIAAAGDIACNPADPNYNNGLGQNGFCQQAAVANLIGRGSYARVLPLGDEQYDCGSLGAFNASYDASWGQFNPIAAPVPGNHEYSATSANNEAGCSASGTGYFQYFANHGVADAAGVNGHGYYSYDLNGWHIIALNSQCTAAATGGCGAGSTQETWLRNDLANHPAQCTLAYWHKAAWSTIGGGAAETRTMWADLANAGAELVLSGHYHHYERFADLDANGQVATGPGLREIIAGTGGESQGSFASTTPATGSEVRKLGYGITAVTLNSGGYSWQYIQTDGSIADSGSESCHS